MFGFNFDKRVLYIILIFIIIRGFIPLSEMFGYATDLRSRTQGRGTYSMEPSHYEEVPKSVFEKIVASRAKKEE